jgi:CheY-like chemotaxis protein
MNRWPFSHPTRILAVDDEIGFTRMLQLAVSQYEIRAENDPLRVIDAAREFEPDLILLDRHMPRMSGDRLAASLQADPKLCRIPIAFVTGTVPRDTDGHACHTLNGCPVLAKPVSVEAIDRCVKDCVKA